MAPFNFHWTTPSRAVGSKALPSIPVEIYLEIFSHIAPTDITTHEERVSQLYPPLALVCRFFCSHFLVKIFTNIEFLATTSEDKTAPIYTRFCRQLMLKKTTSDDEMLMTSLLPSFVKSCVFHGWEILQHKGGIACAFLEMYTRSLCRMTNLSSLTLREITISSRLLNSMKNLQHLTSLAIVSLNRFEPFLHDVARDDIMHLSSLKITSFRFRFSGFQWDEVLISALCHCIKGWALKSAELSMWSLAAKGLFCSEQSFRTLHTLTLTRVEDVGLFASFLTKVNVLRTLAFEFKHSSQENYPQPTRLDLGRDSLKQLQSLSCPPSFIADLLPGRSIVSVYVKPPCVGTSESHPNLARWLGRSSSHIIKLQVLHETYISYLKDAPELSHLSELFLPDYLFEFTTTRRDPLKDLDKLRGTVTSQLRFLDWPHLLYSCNLRMQHTVIQHASSSILPSASTIRIFEWIVWRRFRSLQNHEEWEEWKPYVWPQASYDLLSDGKENGVTKLRTFVERYVDRPDCGRVVDYDGLLASLFPSHHPVQAHLKKNDAE